LPEHAINMQAESISRQVFTKNLFMNSYFY
jgi:hypothetical protein